MELNKSNKDKVLFFGKKELNGPLTEKSRYIEHLADNDPDQPGLY